MTLLQKTCAFARPRAASLVVSALLKAPVPISNVYCCISNDRVSQSCATLFFPPHHWTSSQRRPFSARVFFLHHVTLYICVTVRYIYACMDRHTRVHVHPRLPSDPIWVVVPLFPSLRFSLCLSSGERCSTVFRISEMAREGRLTIFYCSNRPTNDPSREI